MEVILLDGVEKLGELGAKVKVKAGYARNFLLPKAKAVLATPKNLADFEARRAELEKQRAGELAVSQTRLDAINALPPLQLARIAGEQGKLFGSVGPQDIAEAITAAGAELSKQEVRMPTGPIRELGEYQVVIHLQVGVEATIDLEVVAE